jgi:chromosome partition protein MukF
MMSDNKTPDTKEALTVVQSILDEGRHITLSPRDIALLLLIWNYIKTQRDLIFTISDQEIRHLASRLDNQDSRDVQGVEKKYTDSISRLLRSECLSRSDMNRLGLSDDTEYQLTSLGESIASWNFEHERFSGEPLTAILKAFNSYLLKIALDAEEAGSVENWHTAVLVQMHFVLQDMLVNVHRHQQELDRQHEQLRAFIPKLLTESGEASIQFCEDQLAQVIRTIADLQEVTLAAANTAFQHLEKIESIGFSRGFQETETICGEIERRLNSVIQWTTHRATDWVEHHNIVHDFLRTIVNIDRHRRITEALKHAVAAEPQWLLAITDELPLLRFRDDLPQKSNRQQAPRRAKRDYSQDVEEILIDQIPEKLKEILEGENALDGILLSEILRRACKEGANEGNLVSHLPWLIGRLVERGRVDNKTRPWEEVTELFEVEELRVIGHDFHKS